MPRKSSAALSIAPVAGSINGRPEPPESLSLRQAETWRMVVATKPVEWFTADVFPVLIGYCEAIEGQRRIEQIVRAFTPKNPSRADNVWRLAELLDMQRKQAALVASLATKLRLTPQSRYTPKAANTAANKVGAGMRRPWETGQQRASGDE